MAQKITLPVRTVPAWHGLDTEALYDQVAAEQDAALAKSLEALGSEWDAQATWYGGDPDAAGAPCLCHGLPHFDCPALDEPGCKRCGGVMTDPWGTVCNACFALGAARLLAS